MMSWKHAFFAAVALVIASNLAWLYVMVDHGVTDTYTEVSRQEMAADLSMMKRLLPDAARLTRQDIVALLRETDPDALIVDDSAGVSVGGLRFEFERGRLARVADGSSIVP
jgi:predicted metal-dependent TIM-barrel fold hydrolase